jgi:uncharacterized membrane protein YraQ (UPF0718 family)
MPEQTSNRRIDLKVKSENEENILPSDNSMNGTPANKKTSISSIFTGIIIIFTAGYLLFSILRSIDVIDLSGIEVFNTIFISILMQAFPFMLIGVLVSSAMHVFIPDEWIVKVFPTKYGLGFLTAMFAGVFFPVCECAIVPVMTRLVKKGVAMPIAITFMLSAPIINPIVIISTLYAFPGQPEITLMRVGFGLLIALLVGLCMSMYGKSLPMFLEDSHHHKRCCDNDTTCHQELHKCTCHSNNTDVHFKKGIKYKLKTLFLHAGDEFFNVGKYLVVGACITSLIQTLIPKETFTNLSSQSWLSLLIMMTMAFLFSACSTSDAFIARSFMSRFSTGAIMGFMVFGPMMDIKNLLMLLSSFKKSFVIRLTLIIFILNFIVLNFLTLLLL